LDLEYLPSDNTVIEVTIQHLNLLISVITNVCCIYLVPVNAWWWIRLRKTHLAIRHIFMVAIIIKFGIWYWTLKQIIMLTLWNMTLPIETLDNRIIFMIGVIAHVFITMNYYGPGSRTELPLNGIGAEDHHERT
jgi:hypothetical protein